MKKILLVEDDSFIVDIYTTKLKGAGFLVETAQKEEEIFKKLNGCKPDLLLLDIVLPSVDGWVVLEKIKNDENLKNLKVMILSNLGQKSEIEKGLALGAVGYLIKSQYTPSQVVDKIQEILK